MKIGLIEMMAHEGPEKGGRAKAVVLEWDKEAHFIFAEGEEYQDILDGLRAAGALDRKSGEAGHRAFVCLELPPQGNAVAWLQQEFDTTRARNIELERDLDTARKTAIRAEGELTEAIKRAQEAERALREAKGQAAPA